MNNTLVAKENSDFEVVYPEIKKSEHLEKCILCSAQTNIPISMNVSLRHDYVEGAGQLCSPCFSRVYGN